MRNNIAHRILGAVLAAAVTFTMPGVTDCLAADCAVSDELRSDESVFAEPDDVTAETDDVFSFAADPADGTEDVFEANKRVTYEVPGGKLYFEPDTGEIAWAEGDMEELTIPDKINGTEVKLIGRWKLSGLKKLKKINLPKRNILGEGSFAELVSLEEFTIPEGYKTIPRQCFYGCTSLKKISMPSSITTIEEMAFYKCPALEYVDIPGNCASIGKMAFYSCTALKGVAFVKGSECDVTDWGIFYDCPSLEKVVNIPSRRLKMFYESGKRAEKWLDDPTMNQKKTEMWRLRFPTDADKKAGKNTLTDAEIQAREDAIRALAQEATAGCTTDRAKIEAVMTWITEKLEYEKGHDNHPWAIYTGIKEVEAGTKEEQLNSCGGYSNMTQVMLQSLGIPCATVWREDRNGETIDHEFNAAYFEGKWRWLDTTHSDDRKEGLEFDVNTPGFFFNSDHRVDYLLYRSGKDGDTNIYKELPLDIPVEEDVKDWPDQNPSGAYALGEAAKDQDWIHEVDPAVVQEEKDKIAARAAEFPVIAASDESIFIFDAATGTITGMNSNNLTQICIPSTIGGVTVKAIGERAMQNLNKLEYLTMPDTITEIGKYAFANNRNLKRIHLSANITELKEAFMQNCVSLDSITIPAKVKRLDKDLFRNCDSLEEALFEDYDFKIKVIETDPMGSDNYYDTGQADISWYCFAGGSGRALHGLDFHETYIGTKYYRQLQAVELTDNWRENIVKIHQSQKGYREGFSPYHLDGSNSKPFKLSNKAVDYEWGHFAEASRFTGYQPATWCRAFIDWAYAMAGVSGYRSTEYHWEDTVYAGKGGTVTLEPGDMLGMGKSHWCMVGGVKDQGDLLEMWIIHGNHDDRRVWEETRHYKKSTGIATDMEDDDYNYFRAIYKIDFSGITTRTVTLDAGAGTCAVKNRVYCEGAYYGCLPEAVLKDHVFDGWYTEPGGKGKKAYPYRNLGEGVTTLYANYIYKPKAVKSVSLDRETVKLQQGRQLALKATVLPADAEDATVTWRSGNDAVVSVKDGVIKGLKEGTATIMARTAAGPYVAYCEVEVVTEGGEGEEEEKTLFTVTYKPGYEGADDVQESVEADSTIDLLHDRFVRPGYVLIGWKDESGKDYEADQKDITVSSDMTFIAQWIEGCENHDPEHFPRVEATATSTGNIEYWKCKRCGKLFYDEACTREIKSIDDTVIPMLDPEGPIEADTTRYITTDDDAAYVASKTIDLKKLDVFKNPEKKIKKYRVTPEDCAAVDKKGVLTVKKSGHIVIEALDSDGSVIATTELDLVVPGFVDKKKSGTIYRSGRLDMNMYIDSAVQPSSWKVSNKKLATIDQSGLLTIKKSGTVKVTASFKKQNGKTRKLVFTLKIKIPKFSKSTYTLKYKEGKTVTAKTALKNKPREAVVTYSTGDPGIATVDDKGIITAVGKGKTNIIAKIDGIEYTAKVKVR